MRQFCLILRFEKIFEKIKKTSKKVLTNPNSCGILNKRSTQEYAGVAQLVEQLICNQQVGGSSPSTSSKQLHMGAFPSGQRGQTVNLLSTTSVVRIHLLPPKNRQAIACLFFYPSRRLGISSRVSVYIIAVGAYHQPKAALPAA